jgi:beta-lactamase regulating signal transducer with metallopeptidase domain
MMTLPDSWVTRLGELVLQVTLWSTLGLGLLVVIRRSSPQLRKRVLLATCLGVVVLTALASIQPLWRVGGWWPIAANEPVNPEVQVSIETGSLPVGWLSQWLKGLVTPQAASTAANSALEVAAPTSFPGPTIIAVAALVGCGWFLLRFLLGVWRLRLYYRLSTGVREDRVVTQLAALSAAMHLNRSVEVRESAELAGPATLGWRRRLILLPASWRVWSDDELRSVLAHELAHVQAGDFLANVAVQFLRALHGYHPLVHLLARQMRNVFEVLADARAAECVGRERYVKALCELALRPSPRTVRPPALAFLSTLPLSRRMTMLATSPRRTSWLTRAALACTLLGSLAIIAGLRSPATAEDPPPPSQALPAPAEKHAMATTQADLRFLPKQADGVFVLRPALALSLPWFATKADAADQVVQEVLQQFLQRPLPSLSLRKIDQVVGTLRLKVKTKDQMGQLDQAIHLIRLVQGTTWKELLAKDWPELKPVEHAGKLLYRVLPEIRGLPIFDGANDLAVAVPDPQTLLVGSEAELKTILDGTFPSHQPPWKAEDLKHFANAWAFLGFDLQRVRGLIDQSKDKVQAEMLKPYEALWRKADYGLLGMLAEPKAKLRILVARNNQNLTIDEPLLNALEATYFDLLKLFKLKDETLAKLKPLIIPPGSEGGSWLIYDSTALVSYGEFFAMITSSEPMQVQSEITIVETTREALQNAGLDPARTTDTDWSKRHWKLKHDKSKDVLAQLRAQPATRVLANPALRSHVEQQASFKVEKIVDVGLFHSASGATLRSRINIDSTTVHEVEAGLEENCSWLFVHPTNEKDKLRLVFLKVRRVE